MNYSDPTGLFASGIHSQITRNAAVAAGCSKDAGLLAELVVGADRPQHRPETQAIYNAIWHAMCRPRQSPVQGMGEINRYIQDNLKTCKLTDLANALHAAQDSFAGGHRGCQPWYGGFFGIPSLPHIWDDFFPSAADIALAEAASRSLLDQFMQQCPCVCR